MDYSCIDNLQKAFLPNSAHRECLNYAMVAEALYQSTDSEVDITHKIQMMIKRHNEKSSGVKIISLRNILKHKTAVPALVRLLHEGGVWMIDCEAAYSALVKCRVETVHLYFNHVKTY